MTPILILMLSSWAGAPDAALTELRAAIKTHHDTYIDSLIEGDAATYAEMFTEDAVLLRPNAPMVRGRTTILADQKTLLSRAQVISGAVQTVHLDMSGDMAYEIGNFSYTFRLDGGEPRTVGGKFLAIWRRQADGRWLCEAEAGLPE